MPPAAAPERASAPAWLMPAIALVVTLGTTTIGGMIAWGMSSRDESTRERIAAVERASTASILAVRSEMSAAQLLGRTQVESVERQMLARDSEHERMLREQGTQLQAVSMATAQTRQVLEQLREMVQELRDTIRSWPVPERTMPRGGPR